MAHQDYGAGQQDDQGSSTEWVPSGEQPPEQDGGRCEVQDESDQSTQGTMPDQEAQHEYSSLQEHGVPQQDDLGAQPQGAGEPIDPAMEHQDDETPGSAPEEPPEQEGVPVTSKNPVVAGE